MISSNKGEISKEVTQPIPFDVNSTTSSFNLQYELLKMKISIPFNDLFKNNEYREKITRMVKNEGDCQLDTLELTDNSTTIVLVLELNIQLRKMSDLSM